MTQTAQWDTARLADVCELISGSTPKGLDSYLESRPAEDRLIPFFKVGDMNAHPRQLIRARVTVSPEDAATLRLRLVPAGAVVFPKAGGAIATNKKRVVSVPGAIDLNCMAVVSGPRVDPQYLRLWFEQIDLSQLSDGSVLPQLSKKTIGNLGIPVPPLDVQRRIVDILDAHLSRLDSAERQTESANRRVLAWRRAQADELFWGREHPTFELGDLLASPMRNGHSARASASGDGIRTLTLTAVTRGLFTDDFTKVTTADAKRVADLWLRSGDILVQRSNTPELVGTTELYTGPDDWAIFPDLLIRCRVDTARVLPAFAAGAMRTERAHRWLRARAKGLAGSMPKIDQGTIAALRIPVPAMTKQVATVARLAELDASSARLAESCTLANARGRGLRRALLQAAFTGRLTRSTLDVQQLETVRV